MLAIIPKHSLNLILTEADNAVYLDGIDNAGLSPTCEGFSTYAKKFGRLGGGEELLVKIHNSFERSISPTSSRILISVLEFGVTLSCKKSQMVLGSLFILFAISSMVKSYLAMKILSFFLNSSIINQWYYKSND